MKKSNGQLVYQRRPKVNDVPSTQPLVQNTVHSNIRMIEQQHIHLISSSSFPNNAYIIDSLKNFELQRYLHTMHASGHHQLNTIYKPKQCYVNTNYTTKESHSITINAAKMHHLNKIYAPKQCHLKCICTPKQYHLKCICTPKQYHLNIIYTPKMHHLT